jgi:Ca2+:H+ antiporter
MRLAAGPAGLSAWDRAVVGGCLSFTLLAALGRYLDFGAVVDFVLAGLAVACLAALIGRCVDNLGDRLGAGATGVLQSALGNLPELFVGIFALRAGLRTVVQAAIVGSVLGNLLLVLGLAFFVGGRRHGTQKFDSARARTMSTLLLVAVAVMLVPSLASYAGTPASRHEGALSVIAAVVLLVVFALSVPASLRRGPSTDEPSSGQRWALPTSVGLLVVASVLAAVASAWFVDALTPALHSLRISQAFAGLVIVAIVGNAVENFVGIQLSARNRPDYALSVVLNSPLQIVLVLAPVLVLLSYVIGGVTLALVFPPVLMATLAASVIVVIVIIVDGESDWLEGAALVGLYVLVASSFWWG